ncbi:MAG: MATE family efflux transporter [Paracoccaceae bacterium]
MIKSMSLSGHVRATLALGLPLVGSQLAQMALHVTDTVLLGWYGTAELAAGVISTSTFFILFILGAGFGRAVMPVVAAALGSGDETQVRRATRMGLWLSVAFGLLIYPVFGWAGAILKALGQTEEVARLGQEYLRIAGLGMIPALIVMTLTSYLSALGRTAVILWITLAGVALNLVLNWMLIFGNWGAPELGIRGSGIATVSVQVAAAVLMALYAAMAPGLRRFALFQRFWRGDWPALRQVFRLGAPIGLTSLAEGGLFHASAIMMGWIGTVQLAAHGIALEATALAFMVHLGLSSAATIRVGRAWGAGEMRELRDAALVAVAMSALFGLCVVAVFLLFPAQIVGLFLSAGKPDAPAIVAFGTVLMALAALFQMGDAMQAMALGLLRGVQDMRVPMWIAVFSYWVVGIPVSYLLAFPAGMGGAGVWLGLAVGLFVAASLLMARFWLRLPRPADTQTAGHPAL